MAYLHRTTRRLTDSDRSEFSERGAFFDDPVEPVVRPSGASVSVTAADSLAAEVVRRIDDGTWLDRGSSDRWLAPRLHHALRLTRTEAGDRQMWEWLASTTWQKYVEWRWSGDGGVVSTDRWLGPVQKQALMRLWWTAELFRDGSDYSRAEHALLLQDFPNSFLHRPVVRCRSFAIGIVDALFPSTATERKASEVNDLARKLNLSTAGSAPEVATHFKRDRFDDQAAWAADTVEPPDDWENILYPSRPRDTDDASVSGGRRLADHGLRLAGIIVRAEPG